MMLLRSNEKNPPTFQAMLRKLQRQKGTFATTMYRNLCVRILQRRNEAYRLAKFTGRVTEDKIDGWLDQVKEDTIVAGDEATHSSFLNVENPIDMILRFRSSQGAGRLAEDTDKSKDLAPSGDPSDVSEELEVEIDDFIEVNVGVVEEVPLSPGASEQDLLNLYKTGSKILSCDVTKILETLQATSVPAERLFSRARHARRYTRESLSDERYERTLRLKDFYRKSKPLEDSEDEDEADTSTESPSTSPPRSNSPSSR